MNQPNGIFLELERWLGKVGRTGILQIGNFSGEFFKRFLDANFETINYVDNDQLAKLGDNSKVFQAVGSTIQKFNVIFINTGDDGYETVSAGIPSNVEAVIIRYVKGKVPQDTIRQFMVYLNFLIKIEAEHKGGEVTDLLFTRK